MRSATIVVRATPRGFLVCTAAYLGQVRYGCPGETLDPLQCILMARRAAEQGARLLIEIQADGGTSRSGEMPPEWCTVLPEELGQEGGA